MSTFKTLPPELVRRLIAQEPDVLTAREQQRQQLVKRIPCKRCGDPLVSVPDAARPFREGEVLPAIVGKCPTCGYTVDMQSGLVTDTGDARATRPPDPIPLFDAGPE